MSMLFSVEWMGCWFESELVLLVEDLLGLVQCVDVIVIFGVGWQINDLVWGDDVLSLLVVEWLCYVVWLVKILVLLVLISGGLYYGCLFSEVVLMVNVLLQDFGVLMCWQEGFSCIIWENVILSVLQLCEVGVCWVVLVIQVWYMQWVCWSFECQGFEVILVLVGFFGGVNLWFFGGWLLEVQVFWQSGMLLNEVIGLVGYCLFYC